MIQEVMQLVLVVLSVIFISLSGQAVQSFSGYIVQNGNKKLLKIDSEQYTLVSENNDIRAQLFKLKSNDFVSGIGRILNTNILRLETIDFVGLNNFLGIWLSPMGIFKVKDFSSLNLYAKSSSTTHSSLNYSITPADGSSWGMFLTDANQIYFTHLTVKDSSKASIRFFDTKTGAFHRELALSKISQ